MKILFVGSTQGTHCSLHYFTALVRLGHEVLPFDPEFFRATGPLNALGNRFRRGPSQNKKLSVAHTIRNLCRHNQFDLVFVMNENFLEKETIEEIREDSDNPPLFSYHSHDNVFSPGICKPDGFFETLGIYDYLFTTKSQNVERYSNLGTAKAFFIPSAYEPSVHRPIPLNESKLGRVKLGVSFIGTFDRSRIPYVDALGWKDLYVWGDGWKKYPGFRRNKRHITPHAVYYFEFADVFSRSLCSLGLLREEAEDRHTQRTFEIPACGSLQIAPRNDEILSFFEEDSEIICFSSKEELKDKTEYYLAHESERARVASAGHKRCVEGKHTYQDRVVQMLEVLSVE